MPPTFEHTFDPWTYVERHRLTVHHVPHTRAHGYTNGIDTIWLHHYLTRVEERCTLTHEIAHIHHGHTRRCTPKIERLVHEQVARFLIPWDALLAVKHLTLEEAAWALFVTPAIVRDRLHTATGCELLALHEWNLT